MTEWMKRYLNPLILAIIAAGVAPWVQSLIGFEIPIIGAFSIYVYGAVLIILYEMLAKKWMK